MSTKSHITNSISLFYKSRCIYLLLLSLSFVSSCSGSFMQSEIANENVMIIADLNCLSLNDSYLFPDFVLSRVASLFKDETKNWSLVESTKIRTKDGNKSYNLYVCYNEKTNVTAVVYNTLLETILLIQTDGKSTFDEIDEKCGGIYTKKLGDYLLTINEEELFPEELVSFDFSENREILLARPLLPDSGRVPIPDGPVSPLQLIYHTNEIVSTNNNGPLCTVFWEQTDSFNQRLDPIFCNHHGGWIMPPAGCGPIAVGQALTVLRPPFIDFGDTIWVGNWDAITEVVNWSIEHDIREQELGLIRLLGRALHTNYRCGICTNGSSTFDYNIASFYREKLGYENSSIRSYNYNSVVNELSMGRPVITFGYSTSTDAGHIWLIHGSETKTRILSERIYACLVEHPSNPIDEREWRLIYDNTTTTHIGDYVTCNYGDGCSDVINISGIFEESNGFDNLQYDEDIRILTTNN